MSTKSSRAWGDDFHVYNDLKDMTEPWPVHIEIDSVLECDVHHRAVDGKSTVSVSVVVDAALWQRIMKSWKERNP